jgi:hypothetical protein
VRCRIYLRIVSHLAASVTLPNAHHLMRSASESVVVRKCLRYRTGVVLPAATAKLIRCVRQMTPCAVGSVTAARCLHCLTAVDRRVVIVAVTPYVQRTTQCADESVPVTQWLSYPRDAGHRAVSVMDRNAQQMTEFASVSARAVKCQILPMDVVPLGVTVKTASRVTAS